MSNVSKQLPTAKNWLLIKIYQLKKKMHNKNDETNVYFQINKAGNINESFKCWSRNMKII